MLDRSQWVSVAPRSSLRFESNRGVKSAPAIVGVVFQPADLPPFDKSVQPCIFPGRRRSVRPGLYAIRLSGMNAHHDGFLSSIGGEVFSVPCLSAP